MIPFIEKHLATARRVNVIWDRYLPDSLKATTRESRGAGVRQRLPSDGNGKMPKNWSSYLRNGTNKIELFHYLSGVTAQSVFDEGEVVFTTYDTNVLQNGHADDPVIRTEYPLSPCNHEEFGTIVMLHAANAASQGYKRILIIANDRHNCPGNFFLYRDWCREIVGIIWNGQEDEVYFHPCLLQCHVTCKSTCSSCISCPDRVQQHLLLFRHREEISFWKVGCKARAHNIIVPSDGKAPHTPFR